MIAVELDPHRGTPHKTYRVSSIPDIRLMALEFLSVSSSLSANSSIDFQILLSGVQTIHQRITIRPDRGDETEMVARLPDSTSPGAFCCDCGTLKLGVGQLTVTGLDSAPKEATALHRNPKAHGVSQDFCWGAHSLLRFDRLSRRLFLLLW
jgi:hypothetical protein